VAARFLNTQTLHGSPPPPPPLQPQKDKRERAATVHYNQRCERVLGRSKEFIVIKK
jgi:hypothetical protein